MGLSGDTAHPPGELAEQMAAIARMLLSPGTVDSTLEQAVRLAVHAIDHCDEAALCVAGGRSGGTVPMSAVVTELDRLQVELGEGPCPDALAGADSVYVHDLADSDRWPGFGPRAVEAGLRSALCFRLFASGPTLGALQLYARLPAAFSPTDRAQGLIFAAHAGIALSLAQASEREREEAVNLRVALASREVIGQAQGILMERERITAEQAFELLRRASQSLNVKLREVAQRLVDTGEQPGADRSRPPAHEPPDRTV